jgi:hypothetical protein
MAEKDGSFTVNVEPIPFAGWVETTKAISQGVYFTLTDDGQIQFTQEFEVLSGEQKLAALNRAMDLIMAKTGQVIDSLEVQ